NFAAQDAVLAIADFQVAVAAKGRGLHMLGQCLPELVSVITKARIQDGNLDAPAGKARRMPPIRAEPSQELFAILIRLSPKRQRGRIRPRWRFGLKAQGR